MFVLVRALTYATIFIGLIVVYLPSSILASAGIVRPASTGVWQVAGMLIAAVGAAVALWCVLAFALIGKGTPAPFDPPRRLVLSGPYRVVRNPMALGVALVLSGAALFYQSAALWWFTAAFLVVLHLFVVSYEEPTLRRMFGEEYEEYTRRVRRWLPIPRAGGA